MKKKKLVAGLAALTLVAGTAATLASCGETPTPTPEPEVVDTLESISVSGATVTLKVGATFTTGDLVVKAKWSVSGEKTLTATEYTVDSSKVDTSKAGSYKVTVSYQGKTAEYTVTVTELEVTAVTVASSNELVAVGGTYSPSKLLKVTATLEDESVIDVTAGVTIATVDTSAAGAKTVKVSYTKGSSTKEADLTVNVLEVVEIATADELLAIRNKSQEANDATYYKLTADIDLEGVTLESATTIFAGVFDGQGHKISNGSITNPTAKTGIIFAQVVGGIVTNVKFLNCSLNTTNESAGLVTGLCEGGIFTGIEFNSCSAKTTNTYSGLVYARNSKAGNIYVSDITAKNGCQTACSQYGGFVGGDMVKGSTVTFENLDLAGEFLNSSGNGSVIAGRCRSGANVIVNGAIVNVTTTNPKKIGVVTGGGTGQTITVSAKNVAVIGGNLLSATVSGGTADISNSYDISANETKVSGFEAADNASFNVAWLKDTLKLDFSETGSWMTEGSDNSKYRLKASSTNVKSADATISSVKVATTNATLRFKKGEEFSAEGLVVMGTYSDGVQLVLNSSEYTVTATGYDKNADASTPITYTVTVASTEDATKTITYTVTLVEQTGFQLADEFMQKVYLVGDDVVTKNLVVYSVWSDGKLEQLDAKSYTLNTDDFDNTKAGAYAVTVKNGNFATQSISVSVIDTKPTVVDNKVYVNVDAAATVDYEGQRVDGVETFKTLTNAVDYLATLALDANYQKVIYLSAGTYTEKVTIPSSLSNLSLIGTGDSEDDVVITYSAVEDTVDILDGAQYGLDCATVHVNATGFSAYNISIRNDFDYINEASKHGSPQGLALTINGDGAVLDNVHLYGNQDTLYFKAGRVYIKNSLIEGNVDFIFGQATGLAYFDNCEIKAIARSTTATTNTGYVTAMRATADDKPDYGYIFANCSFTAGDGVADGSMSLGRPWGAKATVAMINCSFSAAYSTAAYDGKAKSRWYDMSGNLPTDADFCEYGSTGAGAITEAVAGGKVLTEAEAANYTAANLFATTNGKVTWSSEFNYATIVTFLEGSAKVTASTAVKTYLESTAVTVSDIDEIDLKLYVEPWNVENKELSFDYDDTYFTINSLGVLTGVKVTEEAQTVTVSNGSSELVLTVTVTKGSRYNVTIKNGDTAVASVEVKQNRTLGLELSDSSLAVEGYVLKGLYTDAALTQAYDSSTKVTADVTLYGKYVAVADLTKYDYNLSFSAADTGDNISSFVYDGNVQKTEAATWGPLTVNFDSSASKSKLAVRAADKGDTQMNAGTYFTFEVAAGAYITLTTNSGLKTTLQILLGDTVIAEASSGTSLIAYCATAGTVKVIDSGSGSAYLKSLNVTYLDPITENTTLSFRTDTQTGNEITTTAQGSMAVVGDVLLDATASGAKIAPRAQQWAQFNTGSVIKFNVAAGATVKVVAYSTDYSIGDTAATAKTTSVTFDAATTVVITATGNTYIDYIEITYAA